MAFFTDIASDTRHIERTQAPRRARASFFDILLAARQLSIAANDHRPLPQDALDVIMGRRDSLNG